MVRIVNWLLTRRCNLSCEYCGIAKINVPYYKKNEISTERVINLLNRFRTYNPNIFHIFYGGEPFLRSDLGKILSHCNTIDINYTIISNCTLDIQPRILKFMKDAGGFKGFTASVDPTILQDPSESQSQMKSASGFHFLMKMKNYIDDVVAEVTMTRPSLGHTYDLIKMLSDVGIYTSLTAIDVNKNHAYDFSAYSDQNHLLSQNKFLETVYEKIMNDNSLLIHMKNHIIPMLFKYIKSDFDCGLQESIHNLTIDADGSIRTCLRMRGTQTPKAINDENVIVDGVLNESLGDKIALDRMMHCRGCNHTCVMMSKLINDGLISQNQILDH
jgi:MoaA/NifB/PqqE/SkfB family radical SAM enzyme